VTTTYLPQTVSDTMARIAAGVDPWIAYRDFLEDWTYLPEARRELGAAAPTFTRSEDRRWASLLAATVDALCTRGSLPVPAWTGDPGYRLEEPWYLYEGTGRIRDWLRESTPMPFATRNIWSGDRLLRRT
jgi:hypothetical protein